MAGIPGQERPGVTVVTSVVERVLSDREGCSSWRPSPGSVTRTAPVSLGTHSWASTVGRGRGDLRRGLAPAGAVDSNDTGDTDLCSVVTAFIAALGTWWSRFEKKKKR